MERIQVVAQGENQQAQNNARGKLFEKIVARVLCCHGYDIDEHHINVTYAGMEIDIEGRASISGVPLYAECKCYSSDVGAEKLQNFFAKYMTRWFRDRRSQGLFVAVPGINSTAMGFYREHCEGNKEIMVRLLQESVVIESLMKSGLVVRGQQIADQIDPQIGAPGDRLLLCSDRGSFWLQHIVPNGSGIANMIQLFDGLGHPITEAETIAYLSSLVPEIGEFRQAPPAKQIETRHARKVDDTIVELRGSSACFEYQFPASPEFFVGREVLIDEIEKHVKEVATGHVSSRGMLFEANSGWGKSSLVLAAVAKLQEAGHYAVAIDCRSASSSQFILRVVEHVIERFGNFGGLVPSSLVVSGFDGASSALIEIGRRLAQQHKLLCIFFDQFENIFHLIDVLTKIAQLCLKVTDASTNVLLGFSWKTDLIGLTRDFPYRWRDVIIESCRTFRLKQFSEGETNGMLDRLACELHTPLRRDLRFLLSEFSQGYPWLLKKLCAHVKNQRQGKVPQADMVRGLLNVEQLFHEDLDGLTSHQEETLRRIARLAPVSISDLSDECTPEVLQSLVDRRLIVKVGPKYDVYWDIFRDYLNTGKLPIEEVYLLRAQVGSVLKTIKILQGAGGSLDMLSFKHRSGLSEGAVLNAVRDLRLLHIAQMEEERVLLSVALGSTDALMMDALANHLREWLPRNRCVHNVLRILQEKGGLSIDGLTAFLRKEFPYISAVDKTWEAYARVLATWLDLSDLGVLDENKAWITPYTIGSQIRDRSLVFARRRSGTPIPRIHFAPIVQVATRITSAAQKNEPTDWAGIPRSTIYKALWSMEDLGLIKRKTNKTIMVGMDCFVFALDAHKRIEIAKRVALTWPVFRAFLDLLNTHKCNRLSHNQLGRILVATCRLPWNSETAETNAKVMLDWARHLDMAPGLYAHTWRGQFRPENGKTLFEGPSAEASC